MTRLSLLRQGSELASAARQRELLLQLESFGNFDKHIEMAGLPPLTAEGIEVLQVNLGKLCNQTCAHCHVDAGPDRRELMSRPTISACLDVLRRHEIPTLDITGGAPEMHPDFRWLVRQARPRVQRIIDRSNLTILLVPGHEDLAEFLAQQRVEVIASLPCYLPENTDRQRGAGVFARSIEALRRLNDLGYGSPGSALQLCLVYNPVGPSLPPDQDALEAAYRRELGSRFGIVFNHLYTITNMPISRFLADLLAQGKHEEYQRKLVQAFQPLAAEQVMCRTTLSVAWDGRLYDCDFNQMLEMDVSPTVPRRIEEFDFERLASRRITTAAHCFGCTAGAGSSCTGTIVK